MQLDVVGLLETDLHVSYSANQLAAGVLTSRSGQCMEIVTCECVVSSWTTT
jgi:hypothetical protein